MAYIEARGIAKSYGPVEANRGLSFRAERGRLTALLGENGAGKTTLARILSGDEAPDAGELYLDGKRIKPWLRRGRERPIALVHQHPLLAEELSVAENLALGAEPLSGFFFLDRKAMLMRTVDAAREFGFSINPGALVRDLSPAEKQEAEILRALSRGSEAIILDEPTSLLANKEAESLYRLLSRLVVLGKAVIVVTHRLSELSSRADRFVFLRDGRNSGEMDTFDGPAAYRAMFGEEGYDPGAKAGFLREGEAAKPREVPILEVRGIGREGLRFRARSGEILGFTALAGNGLEELEMLLSGRQRARPGSIVFAGRDLSEASVGERRRRGLAYLPSDRLGAGLDLKASVAENLLALEGAKAFGFPGKSRKRLEEMARRKSSVSAFDADFRKPAGLLSGGQMQALMLDRELSREKPWLLACQPGWGLDARARGKAQAALRAARNKGACVLLLSSEIEEALDLADRIIVLYRGRVALEAENLGQEGLEERIGRALTGEGRSG